VVAVAVVVVAVSDGVDVAMTTGVGVGVSTAGTGGVAFTAGWLEKQPAPNKVSAASMAKSGFICIHHPVRD